MDSLTDLTASIDISAHNLCIPQQYNSDAPSKAKYYVVVLGRQVGIFRDWDDAKASVTGFRDCKFQAFARLNEARVYWDNHCRRNHNTTHHHELKPVSASPSTSALSTTNSAPDTLLIPAAPITEPCQRLPSQVSHPSPSQVSAGSSDPHPPTAPRLVDSSLRRPPTYFQHTQHASSTRSSPPNINSTPSFSIPSSPKSPTFCTTSRGYSSVGTVHGVAILGLHVIYSDCAIAYGAFRQHLIRHLEPDFHSGTFEEVAHKLSKTFQFSFYSVAGASQEGIYTSLYRAQCAFAESLVQHGDAQMYIDGDFDIAYGRNEK